MNLERKAVDAKTWLRVCETLAAAGGRIGALWASDGRDSGAGFSVHVLLVKDAGLLVLDLALDEPSYPDLSTIFPAADRMQRAIRDLYGLHAGRDVRGWLRHGAWPEGEYPLRRDVS